MVSQKVSKYETTLLPRDRLGFPFAWAWAWRKQAGFMARFYVIIITKFREFMIGWPYMGFVASWPPVTRQELPKGFNVPCPFTKLNLA
jgi:hypothetical protein